MEVNSFYFLCSIFLIHLSLCDVFSQSDFQPTSGKANPSSTNKTNVLPDPPIGPPPTAMLPPPPYPPDIFTIDPTPEAVEDTPKLTFNANFQPRAGGMPDEMKRALQEGKTVIMSEPKVRKTTPRQTPNDMFEMPALPDDIPSPPVMKKVKETISTISEISGKIEETSNSQVHLLPPAITIGQKSTADMLPPPADMSPPPADMLPPPADMMPPPADMLPPPVDMFSPPNDVLPPLQPDILAPPPEVPLMAPPPPPPLFIESPPPLPPNFETNQDLSPTMHTSPVSSGRSEDMRSKSLPNNIETVSRSEPASVVSAPSIIQKDEFQLSGPITDMKSITNTDEFLPLGEATPHDVGRDQVPDIPTHINLPDPNSAPETQPEMYVLSQNSSSNNPPELIDPSHNLDETLDKSLKIDVLHSDKLTPFKEIPESNILDTSSQLKISTAVNILNDESTPALTGHSGINIQSHEYNKTDKEILPANIISPAVTETRLKPNEQNRPVEEISPPVLPGSVTIPFPETFGNAILAQNQGLDVTDQYNSAMVVDSSLAANINQGVTETQNATEPLSEIVDPEKERNQNVNGVLVFDPSFIHETTTAITINDSTEIVTDTQHSAVNKLESNNVTTLYSNETQDVHLTTSYDSTDNATTVLNEGADILPAEYVSDLANLSISYEPIKRVKNITNLGEHLNETTMTEHASFNGKSIHKPNTTVVLSLDTETRLPNTKSSLTDDEHQSKSIADNITADIQQPILKQEHYTSNRTFNYKEYGLSQSEHNSTDKTSFSHNESIYRPTSNSSDVTDEPVIQQEVFATNYSDSAEQYIDTNFTNVDNNTQLLLTEYIHEEALQTTDSHNASSINISSNAYGNYTEFLLSLDWNDPSIDNITYIDFNETTESYILPADFGYNETYHTNDHATVMNQSLYDYQHSNMTDTTTEQENFEQVLIGHSSAANVSEHISSDKSTNVTTVMQPTVAHVFDETSSASKPHDTMIALHNVTTVLDEASVTQEQIDTKESLILEHETAIISNDSFDEDFIAGVSKKQTKEHVVTNENTFEESETVPVEKTIQSDPATQPNLLPTVQTTHPQSEPYSPDSPPKPPEEETIINTDDQRILSTNQHPGIFSSSQTDHIPSWNEHIQPDGGTEQETEARLTSDTSVINENKDQSQQATEIKTKQTDMREFLQYLKKTHRAYEGSPWTANTNKIQIALKKPALKNVKKPVPSRSNNDLVRQMVNAIEKAWSPSGQLNLFNAANSGRSKVHDNTFIKNADIPWKSDQSNLQTSNRDIDIRPANTWINGERLLNDRQEAHKQPQSEQWMGDTLTRHALANTVHKPTARFTRRRMIPGVPYILSRKRRDTNQLYRNKMRMPNEMHRLVKKIAFKGPELPTHRQSNKRPQRRKRVIYDVNKIAALFINQFRDNRYRKRQKGKKTKNKPKKDILTQALEIINEVQKQAEKSNFQTHQNTWKQNKKRPLKPTNKKQSGVQKQNRQHSIKLWNPEMLRVHARTMEDRKTLFSPNQKPSITLWDSNKKELNPTVRGLNHSKDAYKHALSSNALESTRVHTSNDIDGKIAFDKADKQREIKQQDIKLENNKGHRRKPVNGFDILKSLKISDYKPLTWRKHNKLSFKQGTEKLKHQMVKNFNKSRPPGNGRIDHRHLNNKLNQQEISATPVKPTLFSHKYKHIKRKSSYKPDNSMSFISPRAIMNVRQQTRQVELPDIPISSDLPPINPIISTHKNRSTFSKDSLVKRLQPVIPNRSYETTLLKPIEQNNGLYRHPKVLRFHQVKEIVNRGQIGIQQNIKRFQPMKNPRVDESDFSYKKNAPPPPIDFGGSDWDTPAIGKPYKPATPPPPPSSWNEDQQTTPDSRLLEASKYAQTVISELSSNKDKTKEGTNANSTKDGAATNESIEADPSYNKELFNAEEICSNCTYVSNFCYLREPTLCNRFIVCYQQGHKVRATEKECSFGSFWSEEKLACTHPSRADCEMDPCKKRGTRNHPYVGKCRAYWTCRRRRSDARCCPKGYAYGGGSSVCVPNDKCKKDCYNKDTASTDGCPLVGLPDSKYEYFDGGLIRTCAPGTRFEQLACTCIRSNVGAPPTETSPQVQGEHFLCKPVVKLDFSGTTHDAFDDKSGNPQSIGVFDVVQTLKDQAMFNGRGNLKLWRFSNVELGPEFAAKFRFYSVGQSHRSETLLSNCIGKNKPAFDIRIDTDILEIVFTVKTVDSPETTMRMFYQPNQWNEVILRYDGYSFSAAIDKVSKTIFVEGSIPTKHAAISIGGCDQDDGFIGYMDDIVIYNKCIPGDVRNLVFE